MVPGMPALHWLIPTPHGDHSEFLESVAEVISDTGVYSKTYITPGIHPDTFTPGDHVIAVGHLGIDPCPNLKGYAPGLVAGYLALPSSFVDPKALLEWFPRIDLAFTSGGMGLGALHAALSQLKAPPAKVYTGVRATTAMYPAGPPVTPLLPERVTGISHWDYVRTIFGTVDPKGVYFAGVVQTPHGIDDLVGCFNALCTQARRDLDRNPYLYVETRLPKELKETLQGYPDLQGRVFLVSPNKSIYDVYPAVDYVLGVDHLDPWPQYIVDAMALGIPVALRDDHVYVDIGTDNRALLLPTPLFSCTGGYYRNGLDTTGAAALLVADLKTQARWNRVDAAKQWTQDIVGTPQQWAFRILSRMGMS